LIEEFWYQEDEPYNAQQAERDEKAFILIGIFSGFFTGYSNNLRHRKPEASKKFHRKEELLTVIILEC
jgi:hypothetical protein